MSCAKIDPALHQAQKPPWIKVRLPSNPVFFSTKALISDLRLHTVCESAQCPNRWECWSQGTATFMIAGDRCTRACGFCAVTTAKPFARKVSDLAGSFASIEGVVVPQWRDRYEKRCHAWSRRKGDRTFPDDGRLARGRLRGADDGPVSAAKR